MRGHFGPRAGADSQLRFAQLTSERAQATVFMAQRKISLYVPPRTGDYPSDHTRGLQLRRLGSTEFISSLTFRGQQFPTWAPTAQGTQGCDRTVFFSPGLCTSLYLDASLPATTPSFFLCGQVPLLPSPSPPSSSPFFPQCLLHPFSICLWDVTPS